ncbi:MAG TPA: hypothetical protein VIC87_01915, partial [Vicinamibacteria bacterium]
MGVAAVLAKASHWSLPEPRARRLAEYGTDLLVSSHADVFFALCVYGLGAALLRATASRDGIQRWIWRAYLAFCLVCVVFSVAGVQIFAYLRSPLTYALLYLADDMTTMRSSIGAFLSVPVALAML